MKSLPAFIIPEVSIAMTRTESQDVGTACNSLLSPRLYAETIQSEKSHLLLQVVEFACMAIWLH
jgi:hypothetical protein